MPSTEIRARAWVEVDLDALCANAERIAATIGPETGLVPMVKADAYGLGMTAVVEALRESLPAERLRGFGVATVGEGEALRRGWPGPILVVAPVPPAEYARAAAADLILCLSDLDAVERWAALGTPAAPRPMHVEIDTGMGRAGLPWAAAAEWGPEIVARGGDRVAWEGCFTHFHSADEPDLAPTEQQWSRFQAALQALPSVAGGPRLLLHVANSAAALRCRFRCDFVRPGIFLYGGRVGAEAPLPVVSVRARVVRVQHVERGTTVGYGATYTAERAERWATLAIGYGDGLPRSLVSGGGSFLVRGRRARIIGRLSMDLTVVDVTDLPEIAAGDEATLLGLDGDEEITLDEVAERAGTISYEILTGLTPRLPRWYRRGSARSVARARHGEASQ